MLKRGDIWGGERRKQVKGGILDMSVKLFLRGLNNCCSSKLSLRVLDVLNVCEEVVVDEGI